MVTDLDTLDAWLSSINVGERFRERITFSDSSQGLSLLTRHAYTIVVYEESGQWNFKWWGRSIDEDKLGQVQRLQGIKPLASADLPAFAIADMVLDALTELGTDLLTTSFLHAKLTGLAIIGWGAPRRDFRRLAVAAALTSPHEISVGEPLQKHLELLGKYEGLTSDPTALSLLREVKEMLPNIKLSRLAPARDKGRNPIPSYISAATDMESSLNQIPGVSVTRTDLPQQVALSIAVKNAAGVPFDLTASPETWTLTAPDTNDDQSPIVLTRSTNFSINQFKDVLLRESNWSTHYQEFAAGMLGYSLSASSNDASGMLRSLELAAPWMMLQGMRHTLRELASGVLVATKGPHPTRLRRLTRLAAGGSSSREDPFEYLGGFIDAWIRKQDEAARAGELMQTHPAEYAFHVTVGVVQRLEAMNVMVWHDAENDSDNGSNVDWANRYLIAVEPLIDALITGRLLRESSFGDIPASAVQPDPGSRSDPRRPLRESILEPLIYGYAQRLATCLRAEAFRLSEARLESEFSPDSPEDKESAMIIGHFERVAVELERGDLMLNPYYPEEIEINDVPLLSHSPDNLFWKGSQRDVS